MAFFFKGVTPSALRQEFGFTARSQDPLCFGHLPRLARLCLLLRSILRLGNRWREHDTEAGP